MGVDLLRDARFWLAVVLLIKTVLFYAVPSFPPDVWGAIDALLAVVIGAMAGVGVTRGRRDAATRGLLSDAERYAFDGQDLAVLLGFTTLGAGLALFDGRLALIVVGGLLLAIALVTAILGERRQI